MLWFHKAGGPCLFVEERPDEGSGYRGWNIQQRSQFYQFKDTDCRLLFFACDFSADTAFLWEKGSIVDLNTLVSPNSQFYLYWAGFIDDRGEIGAFGALPNGDSHAVLLVPCDENQANTEGCEGHTEDATEVQGDKEKPNVVLPENVRLMLQRFGWVPSITFRFRSAKGLVGDESIRTSQLTQPGVGVEKVGQRSVCSAASVAGPSCSSLRAKGWRAEPALSVG